jgi:hypothetical protein
MNDKSLALFGIGAILLMVAMRMSYDYSDSEARDQRISEATTNVGFAFSGQYEIRPVEKRDRTLVYLVGVLGGITIIGGILATSPAREQGS